MIIEARNLSKSYKVVKNKSNFLKNIVLPEIDIIYAVKQIDLRIEQGSAVGFIGPNGAGKSTTIKMLTGILEPTEGFISVNGYTPTRDRKEYVKHIGVVWGNRSQLWWDLPVIDSFELYKAIYKVPNQNYKNNLNMFVELLDLESILIKPVRQLSLGQRMRCEIAIAFLHDPLIVFLDEPTIGLDIVARDRIREFIRWLNKEKGITLFVTSHDMSDIVNVCQSLIVMDQGNIVYDGSVDGIADIHGKRRFVDVIVEGECNIGDDRIKKISDLGQKKIFAIDLNEISIGETIRHISDQSSIIDIKISSTPIENIVKEIYSSK